MAKQTRTITLKVKIGDQRMDRTYYYLSHPKTERYLRFVADDLMFVQCITGRNKVVKWILEEGLGRDALFSSDDHEKFEGEYETGKPSPKLQKILIQEIFTGESYYNLKPHIAIKTSGKVRIPSRYFDILFNYQVRKDRLEKRKKYSEKKYSEVLDIEERQYEHAEELIELVKKQFGSGTDRAFLVGG